MSAAARVTIRSIEKNRVEATNGAQRVVLDLPVSEGGEEPVAGLGPHETLLAALGGCTAMTLLLYARRKGWPLEGVEADLVREKPPVGAESETIEVALRLKGPLDDSQKQRLLEIAQKCPVYKTLTHPIVVKERLA